MISTDLAVCKTIVDIFALEDTYDESRAMQQIVQLIDSFSSEEADVFGRAYAYASSVLALDLPKWRACIDIAVRLDIYEVVEALTNDLIKSFDAHQLASLLTLRENPGVGPAAHRSAAQILASHGVSNDVRRVLEPRINSSYEPCSDLEAAISIQMWPGRYSTFELSRVSPIIYVSEGDTTPREMFITCAQMSISGARVRRIPNQWLRRPDRNWLSADLPLISWSGKSVAQVRSMIGDRKLNVVGAATDGVESLALSRLVARVNDALPARMRLRTAPLWSPETGQAFAPENLKLGAFDSLEMSYLTAASRSVVQRVGRQALPPIEADVHRWRFDQLIALRVFQTFKLTGRTFKGDIRSIQNHLAEAAAASERTRVAIDSNGIVYAESDGGFRSITSNQEAIGSVLQMDEVFRPISLGGQSVPNLLKPSPFTSVHPATLAGTPTIIGRRVPARALAEMRLETSNDILRSAYPELNASEIADGVSVGTKILG